METKGSAASEGNAQMDSAKEHTKIKVRRDIVRIITPRIDSILDAAGKTFTPIVLSVTFPPLSFGDRH